MYHSRSNATRWTDNTVFPTTLRAGSVLCGAAVEVCLDTHGKRIVKGRKPSFSESRRPGRLAWAHVLTPPNSGH